MLSSRALIKILKTSYLLLFLCGNKLFAFEPPRIIESDLIDGIFVTFTIWNLDSWVTSTELLRRTETTPWMAVDTIPAHQSVYIDSTCAPLTQYFYACVGFAWPPSEKTDTSAIIRITTLEYDTILKRPQLSAVWNEPLQVCSLTIGDLTAGENGYYIERKTPFTEWQLLAELRSTTPEQLETIHYRDKDAPRNMSVTYRATVFLGTHFNASFEKTVVTLYSPPPPDTSYTFTLLYAFPVQKPAWIERVGDSLYYPERKSENSVHIGVLNIADMNAPRFEAFISPAEVEQRSTSLRLKLRCRYHTDTATVFNGIDLDIVSNSRYTLVASQNVIHCYDSNTDSLIGSIETEDRHPEIIAFSDSSTASVIDGNGYTWYIRLLTVTPSSLQFGSSYLLYMEVQSVVTVRAGGYVDYNTRVGIRETIGDTLFITYGQGTTPRRWLYYCRLLVNPAEGSITELVRSGADYQEPFDAPFSFAVDEHIVFGYLLDAADSTVNLYALDIRDRNINPANRFVSTFSDQNYQGGAVNSMYLDTVRQHLYLVGERGVFIYRYQKNGSGVRTAPSVADISATSLRIRYAPDLLTINGNFGPSDRLAIYDLGGRLVRTLQPARYGTAFWNKKAENGKRITGGRYFIATEIQNRKQNVVISIIR